MGFDEALGDGEAQARAAKLPRRGVVDLKEGIEDAVAVLRGYADAVVRDAELDPATLGVGRIGRGLDADPHMAT